MEGCCPSRNIHERGLCCQNGCVLETLTVLRFPLVHASCNMCFSYYRLLYAHDDTTGAYEVIKDNLLRSESSLAPAALVASASAASVVVSAGVRAPLDMIKTQLQVIAIKLVFDVLWAMASPNCCCPGRLQHWFGRSYQASMGERWHCGVVSRCRYVECTFHPR